MKPWRFALGLMLSGGLIVGIALADSPLPVNKNENYQRNLVEVGKTYPAGYVSGALMEHGSCQLRGIGGSATDFIKIVAIHAAYDNSVCFELELDSGRYTFIDEAELLRVKSTIPETLESQARKKRPDPRIGMTLEQVIQSNLGPPGSIVTVASAAGTRKRLAYGRSLEIFLTNDIVTEIKRKS